MERVLPVVATLAGRHPGRTVFTRFIPPERPARHVAALLHALAGGDPRIPQLGFAGADAAAGALCPPATVIDKTRYSGFAEPRLLAHLREREADALIISGSETDVCVLATVLSAVDLGYRVIIVRDAVCSSSDEGHDMLLRLYHTRFSEQIETADADTILSRWQ
jgi:nicotinamidase-related amidase